MMIKTKEEKIRNSNIELLRIICIFCIVIHHICFYGFKCCSDNELYLLSDSMNKYIISILGILGKIANNVFFVISGYYIYKSKFTLKKLLLIEGEVLFYTISFFAIFVGVLHTPIKSYDYLYNSFFPSLSQAYWFVLEYMILMIVSPYINVMIENIERKELKKFIIILAILINVLPFTLFAKTGRVFSTYFLCYIIGAYIRKYDLRPSKKSITINLLLGYAFLGGLLVLFISTFNECWYISWIYSDNNPLFLVLAYYLFLLFKVIQEKKNIIINFIAKSSLGIFLIHENIFVRDFVYDYLNCKFYMNNKFVYIYILAFSLAIYFVCLLIDIIRRFTVEKVWKVIVEQLVKCIDYVRKDFKYLIKLYILWM